MTQALSIIPAKNVCRCTGFLLFAIVSAIGSTNALAAVTLNVDDNIKVTAINGEQVNTSLFAPLQTTFTLEPGMHAITAKYDRLFDLRGDDHDYLRSANVSITTSLEDNKTYTLTMPNQPNDYKAAKEYAKHPTLAVVLDNQVIAQETAISSNDGEGGILAGITSAIGGAFGGDDAVMSNQKAIASLESNSQVVNPVAVTTTTKAQTTTSNTSTLDSFMQLWLNATPEERAKIRQWVAE